MQGLRLSGNQFTGCIPAGLEDVHEHDLATLGCRSATVPPESPCRDADNNPGLVSDCEALLASRDTLAGTATLNWSADEPIGEWDGVTLGGPVSHIMELVLLGRELNGEIPPELGDLTGLRWLDLADNQLTGEIPAELGKLTKLYRLILALNQLSGEIPKELGNLSNLATLDLFDNQLSGEIPIELGNLSKMRVLRLYNNQLTGEIPKELGNLSNLIELSI